MEELLPRTAKRQQRLDEAERRTRETAGERAAKRIKLQFADRPVNPASSRSANAASSSSASPSDAIAGRVAQDAGNVFAGTFRSRCGSRHRAGVRRTSHRENEYDKKRAKRQRTEKKTEQEMEVSHVAKVKDSRRILDLRRDAWEPESW